MFTVALPLKSHRYLNRHDVWTLFHMFQDIWRNSLQSCLIFIVSYVAASKGDYRQKWVPRYPPEPVLRIRIRDPVFFYPWIPELDPGYGMGKKSRSRIWYPGGKFQILKHPGSATLPRTCGSFWGLLINPTVMKIYALLSGRRASVQQPRAVLLAAWRGHARPPASRGQSVLVSGHEHRGLPLHRRQILPHRHELPSPPLWHCCGSMAFCYGSGSADPCLWSQIRIPETYYFRQQKTNLFEVFLLVTFWSYIYIIFLIRKSQRSRKTVGIKFFFHFLLDYRRIRIQGPKKYRYGFGFGSGFTTTLYYGINFILDPDPVSKSVGNRTWYESCHCEVKLSIYLSLLPWSFLENAH